MISILGAGDNLFVTLIRELNESPGCEFYEILVPVYSIR